MVHSEGVMSVTTFTNSVQVSGVRFQQWLTDISATRGLDGLDDRFDQAEKNQKAFLAGLARFKHKYEQEKETKGLDEIDKIEHAFQNEALRNF